VENLLEFHRVRDLYLDSVGALGRLAAAAGTAAAAAKSQPAPDGGGGARRVSTGRSRARGGLSPLSGKRLANGQVANPNGQVANGEANGHAAAATVEADPAAEALETSLEATISEAARQIGAAPPAASGKSRLPEALRRKVLGYAQFAWTEYESVEKKWASAQEAMNAYAAPAANGAAGAHNGHGGGNGLGADGQLRRSHSEPHASHAKSSHNPLSLSLSMISANVHDDDDDSGDEHDEW
jgi:hypothetical protein